MRLNKKYTALVYWVLAIGFIFYVPKFADAACVAIPKSGPYTFGSGSCAFATIDGIENGDLRIASGATLTVSNGQILVFNPGYKIINDEVNNRGIINRMPGGQIKKSYLWMLDADGDGYPGKLGQVECSTKPSNETDPFGQFPYCNRPVLTPQPGFVRRSVMTSLTDIDCADFDSTFHVNCPVPTVATGGSANITWNSATITGTVNPHGNSLRNSTFAGFRYAVGTLGPIYSLNCNDTDGTFTGGDDHLGEQDHPMSTDLTNLAPSTTYNYCVTARSSYGSAYGSVAAFTTPARPLPGTPGTPSFSNTQQTTVTVSWTSATEADTYKLERCEGPSCNNFLIIAPATTSPYPDSGLRASTIYRYRVTAHNSSGDGPTSGTSGVGTLAPPPPTYNLNVVRGNGDGNYTSGTQVNISGDAPSGNQAFWGWSTTGGTLGSWWSQNTTLTMPSSNTTTTAFYWNKCANEDWPAGPPYPAGTFCSFSGTKQVRYGSGSSWYYQNKTNGTYCNNTAFGGDPAPNTSKTCWYGE